MAKVIYSEQALTDFERLSDFLVETDPSATPETICLITGAVMVLEDHPYTGRPVDGILRELIISRGHSGYVALYSFEEIHETILILAIRHQQEVGYLDDPPG